MKKYLIEGACNGDLFTETVEADSLEEAEAMAIERLAEAWGEEGDDLSDFGDAAQVNEYSFEDYVRDEAPAMLEALREIHIDDDGDGYCSAETIAQISAILARIDQQRTGQ